MLIDTGEICGWTGKTQGIGKYNLSWYPDINIILLHTFIYQQECLSYIIYIGYNSTESMDWIWGGGCQRSTPAIFGQD